MVNKILTGAETSAEAMRQIAPDVVSAYPITPQTHIIEKFSEFIADGLIDTELIRVESEHSALSACVGASATGARTMTASSSAGLALMFEILGVTSGLRLPVIMNITNRALSSPINIHCDHSDSMNCRDSGWIQIYSENCQEVYDFNLIAVKLAESINLPVMIMQDGFIVSHGVENLCILEDKKAKLFIGNYKPKFSLLEFKKPKTFGALQLTDYNFETKIQISQAMEKAKQKYLEISKAYSKISGRNYNFFEYYGNKNTKEVIVALSSTAGTIKSMIDEGLNLALLKINLFRPFPHEEIKNILKDKKRIIILDRSESYGSYPPLYSEIKSALYDLKEKPELISHVFGIGGREIYKQDIKNILNNSKKYIGVRE